MTQPSFNRQYAGFTLIEVVVTMAILSALVTLLTVGYPTTRDNQALQLAQQQLQFLVRDAQQQALNEEREEECLNQFSPDDAEQRRCSDVGLSFRDQIVIMFADTSGDDLIYDAGAGGDYVITSQELSATVASQDSLLFIAQPPTIRLLVNGAELVGEPARLTLTAGEQKANLVIGKYGQVERE